MPGQMDNVLISFYAGVFLGRRGQKEFVHACFVIRKVRHRRIMNVATEGRAVCSNGANRLPIQG